MSQQAKKKGRGVSAPALRSASKQCLAADAVMMADEAMAHMVVMVPRGGRGQARNQNGGQGQRSDDGLHGSPLSG